MIALLGSMVAGRVLRDVGQKSILIMEAKV